MLCSFDSGWIGTATKARGRSDNREIQVLAISCESHTQGVTGAFVWVNNFFLYKIGRISLHLTLPLGHSLIASSIWPLVRVGRTGLTASPIIKFAPKISLAV